MSKENNLSPEVDPDQANKSYSTEQRLKGLIIEFSRDLENVRRENVIRINTLATEGVELLQEYIAILEQQLVAERTKTAHLTRELEACRHRE